MNTRDALAAETLALVDLGGREPLEVTSHHQRSHCWHVVLDDSDSLFIKRARRSGSGRWSADTSREAGTIVKLDALGMPVARVRQVVSDPDTRLIVLDGLAAHRTLEAVRRAATSSAPAWGARVGESIARLHGLPVESFPDSSVATTLRVFLKGFSMTPTEYAATTGGFHELCALVGRSDAVSAAEENLASWRSTSVIHGDLKSDNMMGRGRADESDSLRLVDWECGGVGDPAWDLGSLIGDYLSHWILSMRFAEGPDIDSWVESARPPLTEVMSEVRAALGAYLGDSVLGGIPERWAAFAGLFLLQRATSASLGSARLSASGLALAQVAITVLERPAAAVELIA